jgi:DNA helicase IV
MSDTKSIKPSFFGRLFGGTKEIRFFPDSFIVYRRSGEGIEARYEDVTDIPLLEASIFGNRLRFETNLDQHHFSLLDKLSSKNVIQYFRDQVVNQLIIRINIAYQSYYQEAELKYLRDSSITPLNELLAPLIDIYQKSKTSWTQSADRKTLDKLDFLLDSYPIITNINKIRIKYEQQTLHNRIDFYDSIESNPLTDAQRLAVIRNNDKNLVLAAAGTGKTSVMVAKALDLIDSNVASKQEILVLAYNKAAAEELKERVFLRGGRLGVDEDSSPDISTFHSLGIKILKSAGITTNLSEFSEDPIKLQMWITNWITNYVKSSGEAMRNVIELAYQPVNPFEFTTKEEYDAYVRDNEYRTLQGERVRGYQELLIANWLFIHSVPYMYEAPYVSKRRVEEGFDYKPDFQILGTNIYLEHFGIDRRGNTRPDIDKDIYKIQISDKRILHKECDTILLETYHYNWLESNLEKRLEDLLSQHEIPVAMKPDKEIFETLEKKGFIEKWAKTYLKCLQAIRVERLSNQEVAQRLANNGIKNSSKYADFFSELLAAYKNELNDQGRIDFDDMIIRAIDVLKAGDFVPEWKHILVDEFQDISMARMEFINTLVERGPNPILTVVGDDWQSIYRFAGGKLELTTRFEELVGSHSLTKLEKTFRYNESIAEIAGAFVMQNPEQYTKVVEASDKPASSQVYLLDSRVKNENSIKEENDLAARTVQVIKKIFENDADPSIAVLARYGYLLEDARSKLNSAGFRKNIKYWTFHGSKGLEADYCVLIGFFQGKLGFPNMNMDEAVVEALLPMLDTYPHSEERRLLYVGLTRARKKSYLIADPTAPSEFIMELLSPKYDLKIGSKTFEEKYMEIFKCPLCSEGYLRLVTGRYGPFYSCSSRSICKVNLRICEKCGAPSIDKRNESTCNNRACRSSKPICDKCGRPMKLRNGKFGQFLGCSGYGIKDDQCKHTRNYF